LEYKTKHSVNFRKYAETLKAYVHVLQGLGINTVCSSADIQIAQIQQSMSQ